MNKNKNCKNNKNKVNKYQLYKEKAREKAMDFLGTYINMSISWSEYAEYTDQFYKLGKRYGLLKEFRENGIC